jgi:hypothetical protein
MPPQRDANRGTMLAVDFLRRTNVALVVLTGVACTKIIGLEALPELGNGGASGRSAQSGGTGQAGGAFSSGGRSANGGAVSSSGGRVATGGSTGDGGGEAGASSGIGGSALGGSSGAGGLMGLGGGSGGTVESGGSGATGGSTGNGGRGPGGSSGTGGSDVGGTSGTGGSSGGGTSGASGSGGTPVASDGPCDVYAAAATPCVGAYSTIRRLSKTYSGPLYQVRSGSSTQNTGTGGLRHDIGMTAEGFADASAQDEACAGSICTISILYDQSGNNNHLSVAKKGPPGTTYSDQDDFESIADGKELTVGDHRVYSLYMEARQGYRLPVRGNGVPFGSEAQGLYMLADGSRVGSQCCWDFGNVSVDPTVFTSTNALFLGTAYWGKGAGAGPWFMADFATGIWAGGSIPDDPGYGDFSDLGPANPNNPSLLVPFALGFMKTDSTKYALRMANAQSASSVATAYQGDLPHALDNQGAIVLGVGADNSNNSFGTFYEGAVLAGFPTDGAELDVLENIKAAGYGQ